MIERETVDRIFDAADIVEVISDFITLKKKGVNYQACCPFHNERTPSFVVSPAKGVFKCFGCGKGGNAVTFVMEHEKMSYPDALKYVARKYGIDVREEDMSEEEARRNDDRESMMVVNEWANDYFQRTLRDTDEGLSIGMSYLRSRGFTDAIIRKFGLGYCPEKGDTFTLAALSAGYKEQYLTDTGLTVKRESGGYWDRFTGRVIFPIHTISGRVAAFGGRIMKKSERAAKYLNSPESIVYSKSNSLYGLFFAKNAITRADKCILVEGYTDVIQMHQKGIENVVASSGTSLTTEQIKLIGRFTKNITVIYDGDSAGVKASLRGIDMILAEGLNVRVVALPEGDDPDSFAKKHSAEDVVSYIEKNEEDFIRFKTHMLLKDAGNDPIKRASLITDIVQSISVIPDPVVRAVFIDDCAKTLIIDRAVLYDEVARKKIYAGTPDRTTRDFLNHMSGRRRDEIRTEQRISSLKGIVAGSSMDELEKEIANVLLNFGHEDFDFINGEKQRERLNVAQTVIEELRSDGIVFRNPVYRSIFEEYCRHYDQLGVGTRVPEHYFTNHADVAVCDAAADILTSNTHYVLSNMWSRHDIYIDSDSERLSTALPRVVALYKSKTIESMINELQRRLAGDDITEDEEVEIMESIVALNEERTRISKNISRLIL